jgi:hypothetical protein
VNTQYTLTFLIFTKQVIALSFPVSILQFSFKHHFSPNFFLIKALLDMVAQGSNGAESGIKA